MTRSLISRRSRLTRTIVIDIVFKSFADYRLCAGTQRLHLEIDMIRSPDDPNVRSIFRDDAAPAIAATAAPFTPASAQGAADSQPAAESLNGNGFHRFTVR